MFLYTEKKFRNGRLSQIFAGSSPDNLLLPKWRACKEEILKMKEGIEPDSWLSLRSSSCSEDRFPRLWEGMVPVKKLFIS